MNYTNLEEAIKSTCENTQADFVSQINAFIRSAEDVVFNVVRSPVYYNVSTSTTMSIGLAEYAISSGAIDIVDVYITGSGASVDGSHLERKHHSFLREAYPLHSGGSSNGTPRYYTIVSAGVVSNQASVTLRVAPAPDYAHPLTVSYYGKSTTDSITSGNTPGGAATTETWLSVAYPDVLLYGALARAYIYMKGDPADIQRYEDPFNKSVLLFKNMGENRQGTDVFSTQDSTSMDGAKE